ncbi:MAG: ATP-dependent helicase HrpB [Candidatus Eisenbacteria bacterium]
MISLPIDAVLPRIVESLRTTPRLVLKAPPGAGKTTRVPAALLDAGLVGGGEEIWVLEPRRVAARRAAERVAHERGGTLGQEIGYQVRFEERASKETRLRFVTEGILTRRLLRDGELRGIGAVLLDEFHERSLEADLALALLREAQEALRPELRLVAMSATLDAGEVARYLDAPVIESEGRAHPVELRYEPWPQLRELEARVAHGVRSLVSGGVEGSILCFVPGAAEIRRCLAALAPFAADYDLCPLHGDLSNEEQDRAIREGARPRIIVATNLAEASLTVDGVRTVVDSGLARVKRYDPARGLDRLHSERISRSSAAQRAGRAGRVGPGVCLRLYRESELESWAESSEPEIARCDLAPTLLDLFAWGVTRPESFGWLTPPSEQAIARGLSLLRALDAIEGEPPRLTDTGRGMARLPLHPRQARVLVEAGRRGVGRAAAALVALSGERDLRREARAAFTPGSFAPREAALHATSDLWVQLDLLQAAVSARFDPRALDRLGVDGRVARRVASAEQQILRLIDSRGGREGAKDRGEHEEALLKSLLLGHPDRVVRRHGPGALGGVMVGGLGVRLEPTSVVREGSLFLALDAESAHDREGRFVRVRAASLVREAWLRELFPRAVREESASRFDPRAERVVGLRRTSFLDLVLEEKETGQLDPDDAMRALVEAALASLDRALTWTREAEDLRDRVLTLVSWDASADFSLDAWLAAALPILAYGKRSFADLCAASLVDALQATLPAEIARGLEARAPARLHLPSGRAARLEYRPGEAPVLAARLQEFFGSEETPRVDRGRVPVLLHLLAPSHRPLQVTSDLASFWKNVYPKVRGELRRKYPRHSWPDDPMAAKPEARPGGRPPAAR